jgi:hypothetical protein
MLACSGEVVRRQDVETVAADVSGDVEWSGTLYLRKPVVVQSGATLTVAAGVQVIAARGAGVTVAEGASLIIDGSGDEVLWCAELVGADARATSWNGIEVGAGADSSTRLSGLVLMDAGADGRAALTLAASATVQHVQVIDAPGDGVRAADFRDDSIELSVFDSGGRGLVLEHQAALASLPDGITLSGNGDDRIHTAFAESKTTSPFATRDSPTCRKRTWRSSTVPS